MHTANSPLLLSPHQHYSNQLGEFFFFDTYFIAEFREGVHVTYEDFEIVKSYIFNHYRETRFGFISNRVNSFSIELKDAVLFNKDYPNLEAYAVVAYKNFSEQLIEVENRFFKFNRRGFRSLTEALVWIKDSLS